MVKVTRSYPAPESLAREKRNASGTYNGEDVINQLRTDFHNKCYLCNISNLSDIQVEHLKPHHNGKKLELKFDWDNLFLSCPHCNQVKNHRKYDDKILDCCKLDPELYLEHYCEENCIKVQANVEDNDKAMMTASLITEIFNLKNTGIRTYATEHRCEQLIKEMNLLYKFTGKYRQEVKNGCVKFATKKTLSALLQRESQFAAFKRSYIKRNKLLYPEIQSFIES